MKKTSPVMKWLFAILLSAAIIIVGIANAPLDTNDQEATGNTDSSFTETGTPDKDPPETDPPDTYKPVGTGKADPPAASDIPAYSGSIFIPLNNNIPNFSSDALKTTGYEAYGKLDSLGRVTAAVASLGKETMPKEGEEKESISHIKPTGWKQKEYDNVSGKYLYNRCHLIGWQLSAENANKQNLITGTRYFNTEGMLPFENMVADYIKETGNHVAYRVTPVFAGKDLLCKGVQIEAYSIEDNGEGVQFNVFVYNVQPDISINYATGDSSSDISPETEPPAADPPDTEGRNELVWITKSGEKYHSKATCSSIKDPTQVTKEEAISMGREPCKKCY